MEFFEFLSHGDIDLSVGILVALLLAGVLAGWIDAVVGGGGLIQLPVLLLVPGVAPIQALATNKIGSIAGTTVSAITYLRRVQLDKSVTLPGAFFAFSGAVLGRTGDFAHSCGAFYSHHFASAFRRWRFHTA